MSVLDTILAVPGKVCGALDALNKAGAFRGVTLSNVIMRDMAKRLEKDGTLSIKQIDQVRKRLPQYSKLLNGLTIKEYEILSPFDNKKTHRFMMHNPKRFRVFLPRKSLYMEIVEKLYGLEYRDDRGFFICDATKRNGHVLLNAGFVCDSRVTAFMQAPSPEIPLVDTSRLLVTPYQYQIEGISYLFDRAGRALVADEMGLGKTGEAIGYVFLADLDGQIVCVTEASHKLTWQREITMWTGDTSIYVADGRNPNRTHLKEIRQHKWLVLNYDILHAWKEYLRKIRPACVIYDEAQAVKNLKSKRTRGAISVAKRSRKVIALSGTPFENRPIELLPIIQMIDSALFPFRIQYAEKFCALNGNDMKGSSNTKGLHRILTDSIMIRRKKEEVLKELPSKRKSIIPVTLSAKYAKEYQRAENDFMGWLKNTYPSKAKAAKRAESLVQLSYLKRIASRGKLEAAIEWIRTYTEQDEKLVVFAIHHEIIDSLHTHFKKISVVIDGRTPSNKRRGLVDKFQEDPSTLILFGGLKPAGTGWTLTAAKSSLTLEYGWTKSRHDQAEDRVHRIGQKRGVVSYYMIADRTIDLKIAGLIDQKGTISSEIIDGEEMDVDEKLLNGLMKSYSKGGLL